MLNDVPSTVAMHMDDACAFETGQGIFQDTRGVGVALDMTQNMTTLPPSFEHPKHPDSYRHPECPGHSLHCDCSSGSLFIPI